MSKNEKRLKTIFKNVIGAMNLFLISSLTNKRTTKKLTLFVTLMRLNIGTGREVLEEAMSRLLEAYRRII